MGNFIFHKRVHVFPGLNLNLGKTGASVTMGVRGLHYTVGRGGIRQTIGLPGTGIYYTSKYGHHTGIHSSHVENPDLVKGHKIVFWSFVLMAWITWHIIKAWTW